MSRTLPEALTPWRPWLDRFGLDQALALAPLLLRLESLLGEFRGHAASRDTEPAGIDDLRRRGPYHRLLLSEWALSQDMPDEFLRRAAQGEHLFLAPRLQQRRGDTLNVVVFDAGPDQLGAPRLAHLALWILLARRAEAAGHEFRWGLLQEPGVLHAADDVERLLKLLGGRTLRRDPAPLAAWQQWLQRPEQAPGERWLVGAHAERPEPFSHHARIRRGFGDVLYVGMASARRRRDIELPLPAADAAKLLRGSFAPRPAQRDEKKPERKPVSGTLSLQQPPLIAAGGRHVAVALVGESAMLLFTRRGRKSQKRAAKLQWPMRHTLLAVALNAAEPAGMLSLQGQKYLTFWKTGIVAGERPPPARFVAPPGTARWLPALWLVDGNGARQFFVLDQAGHLHVWTRDPRKAPVGAVRPDAVDEGVLAMVKVDATRFAYLRQRDGWLELVERHRHGGVTRQPVQSWRKAAPKSAFIAGQLYGGSHWAGAWCVPAASGEAGLWQVMEAHGARERHRRVPNGAEVVGLAVRPGTGEPSFDIVALRPDRRSLVVVDAADEVRTIYTSDVAIATVSVATDWPVIALVTQQREFVALRFDGTTWRDWDEVTGE